MTDEETEKQFAEKDSRAADIHRKLTKDLRKLRPGAKANRARELLGSPGRLTRIPLANFGVKLAPDGAALLRGVLPVEMSKLLHHLQQIEGRQGKPRARAEALRLYLIEEGIILPRMSRREGDGLLWVRFLMDGEPAEEALQRVARLTSRMRDTVHRNVSRFFADLGLRPPVSLPQPDRTLRRPSQDK